MRTKLLVRNAVCMGTVKPGLFEVDDFAASLELGPVEEQVVLPDLSFTEWEHIRLQILPDRLQLGFKESARSDLLRRAIELFVSRKNDLLPRASLGFNAGMQITLEEGEKDPSSDLIDASRLASALGATAARGGVTLVFDDKLSRWWIELSPDPDEPGVWIYDFNRQLEELPDSGDAFEGILDWFSRVDEELLAQFETIVGSSEESRR